MHIAAALLVLVVRTYNTSNMPARDVNIAKLVAANILHRAGVETTWIACPQESHSPMAARTCTDALQTDEVMVRILRAPGRKPEGAATDVLGDAHIDVAAGTGALATLYVDRIAAMAGASSFDTGTLLGRVMAHEIGHLLLGSNAHQRQGIMRATWSPFLLQRSFRQDWEFTPGDVRSLARNLAFRKLNSGLARQAAEDRQEARSAPGTSALGILVPASLTATNPPPAP